MQLRNKLPAKPAPTAAVPTSTRGAAGAARADEQVVLDAARRLVLSHGISRTTLTDVAREAGLSRMTVYRHWQGGLPEILGRMMQREWDALLDLDPASLAARADRARDVRQFVVDEAVSAVRTLRESELLGRILEVEPQLLLPYLVERPGTMHRAAIAILRVGIKRGQADGSIVAGDPVRMATAVVLAAQSWAVSLGAAGVDQEPALMDEELHRMLETYLRPAAH